ncbi:VOC family protein [Vibrio sp. MA40-2]|uniref:VOC family protein n=1 Tax=Vibrio sp. MA40-2 TaxID=3391828 RepID=UPI0039A781DC
MPFAFRYIKSKRQDLTPKLTVSDMDKAIEFYTKALGLTVIMEKSEIIEVAQCAD